MTDQPAVPRKRSPDEQRVLDETPMPMPAYWRGTPEQWANLVLDQARAFGEL